MKGNWELVTSNQQGFTGTISWVLNFSSDLSRNEVLFSVGLSDVKGLPLRVSFPSDGDAGNGLESRLTVIAPGGVTTGNLTLTVNGISAGQRGYVATPHILSVKAHWVLYSTTGIQGRSSMSVF